MPSWHSAQLKKKAQGLYLFSFEFYALLKMQTNLEIGNVLMQKFCDFVVEVTIAIQSARSNI
jgi:hypothetical protein